MMHQLILIVKKNYKTILIIIGSLLLLYGVIWITTRKPQIPTDLKTTIDSLINVNKQLIERQKQIDSTISLSQQKIAQIDYQINNIKEKTTIIREYYHEVSGQVGKYTPSQVDSFLKARYNY